MNLDELLAQPDELKWLRTWREAAYQRGIMRLNDHVKYHHCNEEQMGYCAIYPQMLKDFEKEIQEYDNKLKEYLEKK